MKYNFHNNHIAAKLILSYLRGISRGKDPLVVAIVGGSASGKTSIARELQAKLDEPSTLISQDDFMLGEDFSYSATPYVWDDPENFNLKQCETALINLKKNRNTKIPIFDIILHRSIGERLVRPEKVILWEGMYAIKTQGLRNICDVVIYIEAPFMMRLVRRIGRHLQRKEEDIDPSLPARQMLEFVQPAHNTLVVVQRRYANMILRYVPTKSGLAQALHSFSVRPVGEYITNSKLASAEFDNVSFELYDKSLRIIGKEKLLYSAEISKTSAKAHAIQWGKNLISY